MAKRRRKQLVDFDWDFDKRDQTAIEYCEIDPNTEHARELLRQLGTLFAHFPQQRRLLDLGMRGAAKSKHVSKVIEAIDALDKHLMKLPPEVLTDMVPGRHEYRLLQSIGKRAGFQYPFTISIAIAGMTIEHSFGMAGRRSGQFSGLRRFLARTRSEMKRLNFKYGQEKSRRGRTRSAEKSIQRYLFKIFDTFYRGALELDREPGTPTVPDSEYVNRMAEFTDYILRSYGVKFESLGKTERGRVYDGRLGRAALEHCKSPMYFADRKAFRDGLKEGIADRRRRKKMNKKSNG
jgi:hypothetical protein